MTSTQTCILFISRRQSTLSIHRSSIVASHLSIPPHVRKASSIPGESVIEGEGGKPAVSAIREMSNCQLLANPYFLLIGLSNVLGMLGFYTPFVYLPSMANGKYCVVLHCNCKNTYDNKI